MINLSIRALVCTILKQIWGGPGPCHNNTNEDKDQTDWSQVVALFGFCVDYIT